MSLFSDALEELGLDPTDLEPAELKELCGDPVFRAVAKWCLERHDEVLWEEREGYDADELGIDPEAEADEYA